ncbi:ligand-binding sensor domain-containing diguanylate cyclase [Ideonella oryzae]|uniref:Diguanylate cyclase n=1 Tax=Ideonella oryzae TaxID=2937441 RepID=A0ABT1BM67_9BURK|nr:ligand-binding sensor domain-containing diguanylate cyclase [Ideonella oryzae]MCO5977295.1 diguanylate cyclase [Ideonella oryzae]
MLRGLLLFLCLALSGLTARAEPFGRWNSWDDRLFQRIANTNGEPNDLGVMTMAQDTTGFLWVGTQQGLVRWDGYRLRTYSADLNDPHGLPDGYIQSLWVGPDGTLWVGTASHGLVRYRAATDDFQPVGGGPDGLRHVGVNALAGAPGRQLWVGTEAGLDRLDPVSGRAQPVSLGGTVKIGQVNAILTDRAGRLWVGTAQGLFRGSAEGADLQAVSLPGVPAGDRRVSRLLEDSRGRLWVAVDHHGLQVLDPVADTVQQVDGAELRGQGLRAENIRDMVDPGHGQIWVGTQAKGLLLVDEATLATRSIHRNVGSPYGLDSDGIWSLFKDRSDVLWVGTARSLLRHNLQTSFVHTILGGDGPRDTLRSEDVPSVNQMPDGRLWLGVGTEGVDIVDPARGVVGRIRADPSRPRTALPNEWVTSVLPLPAGRALMGTRKGLYTATLDGRQVRRLEVPGRRATEDAQYLVAGWTGYWVGGGDGMWRLTLPPRGPARADTPEAQPPLSDRRVRALTRGSTHHLWVGTSNGINLLNEVTREVSHLGTRAPALNPALASANVMALLVDRRGWLWVATGGTGLFVIEDPEGLAPRVRHLGTAQGLPKDFVNQVLQDDGGQIWASTDQGIVQIDPATLGVRSYGAKDGVSLALYWGGSGGRTAQGEMIFGGLGGVSVVVPQVVGWRAFQAPVVATEVWVGGKPQPLGDFNQPGHPGLLRLPPGVHDLAVEFAALDFLAPSANRYAYRLTGYDETWVNTDASRRRAAYTNLPPGEYRLELRASNADGLWTEPPLTIRVDVEPAWYQHAAARVAMGLLALLALWGLLRARTHWLTRRQHELEQLVAERTAELQQRTAELQRSQAKLAEMAYFDALTGLPNRRMLAEHFERLASAARREGRGGFALLLLDMDRFKQINDSLGHAAGDALLQATAERLRQAVREVDTVARIGGDEFAILLSGLTEPQAIEPVCRRIVQAFEAPVMFHGEAMRSSPSFGVACYPTQGRTLDELSREADRALYEAKDAGRNTWRFASADPGH